MHVSLERILAAEFAERAESLPKSFNTEDTEDANEFHTEGTAKALASRISAAGRISLCELCVLGGYEFNSAALSVPYVVT
jgi:hypothetical protein